MNIYKGSLWVGGVYFGSFMLRTYSHDIVIRAFIPVLLLRGSIQRSWIKFMARITIGCSDGGISG
jgi:hypothetical protein